MSKAEFAGHKLRYVTGQTGDMSANCPLTLPDGTYVDLYQFYAYGDYDGAGTDYRIRVVFRRVNNSTGGWSDVAAGESYSPNWHGVSVSPDVTINNQSYSYYLWVYFYRNGQMAMPTIDHISVY